VLQQSLAPFGAWYLVVLGAVAIVVAIWAPRGIWGLFADRFQVRLFPVGYRLWPAVTGVAGEPASMRRSPRGARR